MKNWIKQNTRLTTIIGVGILANMLLLFYVYSISSGIQTLRNDIEGTSDQIRNLSNSLPTSTQMLGLSNQLRVLKNRKKNLKEDLSFSFSSLQKAEASSTRKDVLVQDQIGIARDRIKDQFQKQGRTVPDALGFPSNPEASRFEQQMRQVELARHLFEIMLDRNVKTIDGMVPRPEFFESEERDKGSITLLSIPLQMQFQGTLKQVVGILYSLQKPEQYVQLLSVDISALEQASETKPVLETRITVAPISLSKKAEEKEKSQEGDGSADDNTTSNEGDIPLY